MVKCILATLLALGFLFVSGYGLYEASEQRADQAFFDGYESGKTAQRDLYARYGYCCTDVDVSAMDAHYDNGVAAEKERILDKLEAFLDAEYATDEIDERDDEDDDTEEQEWIDSLPPTEANMEAPLQSNRY